MRQFFKYIIVGIITLCAGCFVQNASAKQINLNYNISYYKYLPDSVYVVVSFAFQQEDPKYIKKDDLYLATLSFEVEFKNPEHPFSNIWQIDIPATDPAERKGKLFIGTKQFAVHEGKYEITVKIHDLNDISNYAYFETQKEIDEYEDDEMQMSDIEIGYQIDKLKNLKFDPNPDFVKADLYFIPNPSNEIYGATPEFVSYTEIYNYNKEKYDSLIMDYKILSSMNSIVWHQSRKRNPKVSEFYDIYLFVPDTIPSGTYFLEVSANCYKNNTIANFCNSRKKFFLMNPQRSPELNTYFTEDEQYARSEFASFTDEQCDNEFAQIRVISSKAEREIWSKLKDYAAKKKYLYAFWSNRREDKSSLENRSREEFHKRIDKANTFYCEGGSHDGWNTDRGKILLKYGEPTSVDTYPSQDGNKPYEVWNYQHIAGGVKMFFVDVHLSGRYKLVHSTHMDEVQNTDWETRILPLNRTNSNNEY